MVDSRTTGWLVGGALLAVVGVMLALLLSDEPAAPSTPRGVADTAQAGRTPMLLPPTADGEPAPLAGQGRSGATAGEAGGGEAADPEAGPTHTLAGHLVRLADGSALVGAEVGAGSGSTRTEALGRFRLEGVPDALPALTVRLPDSSAILTAALPARQSDRLDLELVVDTGWIVSGSVHSASGVPLPEAVVSAAGRTARTDASGAFMLLDLLPDRVEEGLLVSARAALHRRAERRIELPPGRRRLGPLDLELEAAGALVGSVTDGEGRPLAGQSVAVRLRLEDDFVTRAGDELQATSDDGGAYRIDGVPEGRYIVSVGSAHETSASDTTLFAPAMSWHVGVECVAGAETRLDASLAAGAAASGRVLDAAGARVGGAQVEARQVMELPLQAARRQLTGSFGDCEVIVDADRSPPAQLRARVGWSRSAADGSYVLGRLPAAPVELQAAWAEQPGWLPAIVVVELPAGSARDGIDLLLGVGEVLRGVVYDAGGAAASGARVTRFGYVAGGPGTEVTTDAEGRFEFLGLPEGRLRLLVSLAGHHTQTVDALAGGADLRVDLLAAMAIEGQVVDAETGLPITDYMLRLEGERTFTTTTNTWEQGRFALMPPDTGALTLTVRAEGYHDWVQEGVLPEGGELRVRLHRVR